MKNLHLLFTAAIICLFIAPSYAGDTKLGGIRAGWHYSNIYLDGDKTDYPHSAFYIGFYHNNKIAPIVNFTKGLEYFQNGYFKDSDNKSIMHTLSVPLALKLKLGPAFLTGGAAANFMVSEDSKILGQDFDNETNVFDVPLFLGAGASILMFSLEARYHWGMLEINDTGAKNQYFQLGVGFEF